MSAFDQMKTMAIRYMRPVSHKDDLLVHDHNRLYGDDAPPIFGWVLRELGTLFLDPRMDREHIEGYIKHLEMNGGDDLFFWFDGKILNKVSFEDFKDRLWNAHNPSSEGLHNSY